MNLYKTAILESILVSILFMGCSSVNSKLVGVPDSLRKQSIEQLKLNLRTQTRLVKVHSAEFLLSLDLDTAEVLKLFTEEEKISGTEPKYRITIWRVLAQADQENKRIWVDKILSAYRDLSAPDRENAAESLAKLKISPLAEEPIITKQILNGGNTPLSAFTFWAVSGAITSPDSIRINRNALLELLSPSQKSTYIRSIAAVALNRIGGLDDNQWHKLSEFARAEPDTSAAKLYLLSAAFVTAPEDSLNTSKYGSIREDFLKRNKSPQKDERNELATALSKRGGSEDLYVLASLLKNKNPISDKEGNAVNADIRSTAAYAILKIDERLKKKR